MNIKNIINGYLGNTQVNRIYRGSELVWSKFAEDIPIVSLTITGDVSILEATTTTQLGISYNPSNTTQVGVNWSSSNESLATVDSNGLVTGVSVGYVIITATSIVNGAISDTYSLEITPEVI